MGIFQSTDSLDRTKRHSKGESAICPNRVIHLQLPLDIGTPGSQASDLERALTPLIPLVFTFRLGLNYTTGFPGSLAYRRQNHLLTRPETFLPPSNGDRELPHGSRCRLGEKRQERGPWAFGSLLHVTYVCLRSCSGLITSTPPLPFADRSGAVHVARETPRSRWAAQASWHLSGPR